MSETAKEIAKAVTALAEVAMVPCRLLENLASEPTKELGGLLGDRIRQRRTENIRRFAERTQSKLLERGLLDKEIPIAFLGPAIEHVGDVEDPELRELWAELITNATESQANQHPRFLQTLAGMNSDDALAFSRLLGDALDGGTPSSPRLDAVRQGLAEDRLFPLGLTELRRTRPTSPSFRRTDHVAEKLFRAYKVDQDTRRVSGYGLQFARAIGLVPPEPK